MSSSLTATKEQIFAAIDENVFLGSMKQYLNHSLLEKYKIVRVLTLTWNRPDKLSEKVPGIYYKHISLDEFYTNNMILFFDECYQYISEAQNYDENIVIMSKPLESMSVTIVMAFIMKNYRMSRVETLIQIQQNWKLRPHKKFTKHLDLWQYMDFRLKANEPFLRRALIDWFRAEFEIIFNCEESDFEKWTTFVLITNDYIISKGDIEDNDPTFKRGISYICKKCGKHLFSGRHIIRNAVRFDCHFICTEPLYWTLEVIKNTAQTFRDLLQGQINCYSCDVAIGFYDWEPTNGCQCPLHSHLERYTNFVFYTEEVVAKCENKRIKK